MPWRPSSPQISYLRETDMLGQCLGDLERMMMPERKTHSKAAPLSWERAMRQAAEKRFDHKPASYSLDLRLLARLLGASMRASLERLRTEHPNGWLTSDSVPIDPWQPLPVQTSLCYWIPLKGGPSIRFG